LDARLLAVSRAGEMAVALESADDASVSTLARVPFEGGTPRPVLEHVPWADWDPAGTELAIVHTVEGKDRLEYPIGKVLYETVGMIQGVRISPKGDLVAFGDCPARYTASCAIAVVDRAGSKRALTHTWWYAEAPAWAAAGDELWFTGGEARTRALYAVSLSGRERLITNVPGRFTLHDIAADGRALLEAYDYPHRMMVRPRGQEAEQDLTWFDYPIVEDISDDGQTVLFAEAGMAATSLGADDVTYLRRADGSPAIELGPGLGSGLSPDGKWVVSIRKVDQHEAQIALLPTGTGEPVLLARDQVTPSLAGWFPDGKRIIVQGAEAGGVPRLYVRDVAGGRSQPLTPEGVIISSFVISPQGTEVVAGSADRPIMSYPVGGGEPVPVLELADTDNPIRFSKDGHWLYFAKATNRPVLQIDRLDWQTREIEPWLEIRPPDPAGFRFFGNIALTPDGMAYAYDYLQNFSHLYVAEGLR
jgi:eukaryotic-like serine/threonine-protein kinase